MNKLIENIRDWKNWQIIKFNSRQRQKKRLLNDWIKNGKKIPPPHVVKQEVIKDFQRKYSLKILVETGTFRGEMVYNQRNNFDKIISIELSKEIFEATKKRMPQFNHIKFLQGNSAEVLKNIIDEIKIPAVFWLDGHYSGFETAKGDLETPVVQELKIILNSNVQHIVLIDDARMFTGQSDYPTIDELKELIKSIRKDYQFTIEDDIIRILPI